MSAPVPDVKAATQRAQQELDWLRCHKEASLEAWQEHVRAYVLERFLLDREEEEEGIIPLAQKSVEKLTGIPRETLAAADRPSGCTAATAVLDKKVLLILSLCKGLSVTIPVAEALLAKGALLGTVLSFMMAVTTLSLPSLIMLRKAVRPRLLAVFVAICTAGILLVGCLFNLLAPYLI